MKFVVAVVMLALAVGAHASLWAGHLAPAVSYVSHTVHPSGHWGGHWDGAWDGHWAGGPSVAFHGGDLWGHGAWGGYPGISLSQGHGVAPYGFGHGYAHGHAGYVAKTRGAVHTAPLAGHVNSVAAVNVAPAPGTH